MRTLATQTWEINMDQDLKYSTDGGSVYTTLLRLSSIGEFNFGDVDSEPERDESPVTKNKRVDK